MAGIIEIVRGDGRRTGAGVFAYQPVVGAPRLRALGGQREGRGHMTTNGVTTVGTTPRNETIRKPLAVRFVAIGTLSSLPAPAAVAVIAALTASSWGVAMLLGGGGVVAPHWFYIPIFMAGLRFGPIGALLAAGIAMEVAGPLLPDHFVNGVAFPQATSDWVSRGIFFVVIGQFVTLLFGAVRQLSEREAQAEGMRSSDQRYRSLVQRANDMILVIDSGGKFMSESSSVERILGWEPGRRIAQPAIDFVHPDDRERASAVLEDVLATPGTSYTVELRQNDSKGLWHWVESTVTNLVDEPTVQGLVLNSRVVDERKALEEELIHRALHDSLTGLANRVLLRERLESALVRHDLDQRPPGLLFIDLDDFKDVNDAYGHEAGDRLLVEIGRRLRACARPEDLVARFGGDEFAMLIEEDSGGSNGATVIAQRVLDLLRQPFDDDGHTTPIGASIGIASYRDGTPDADMILRQADIAMYNAKSRGKAQYAVFSSGMEEIVRDRVDIESELQTALEHDQISVFYQPIVDLATREIEAVEALIRWRHPTRELLLPADFLQAAETTGLIVPLGRLVLKEACRQVRRWREGFKPDIRVSVNLSATQLKEPSLVDDVRAALRDAGIDGSALILEVTEGAVFGDLVGAAATLESLRSLGVNIAVDDFGTGYSSLSHLQHFPVDIIKVDKSFVDNICGSEAEVIPGQAVIVIGQAFHLEVIAEGVESVDQDAELVRLSCGYGQGFLYGRPTGADAIDELLGAVSV
jgi:diguanylate cyclase (GGDEF)-like protein/PAS domain S-box-containing protein